MGGDTVDMGGQSRRPWAGRAARGRGPSGNWDLGMRGALPVGAKALTVNLGGDSQQPPSANSPPSAGPAGCANRGRFCKQRKCVKSFPTLNSSLLCTQRTCRHQGPGEQTAGRRIQTQIKATNQRSETVLLGEGVGQFHVSVQSLLSLAGG